MFDFGAVFNGGESAGEKEPMTTMGFLDHLEELRKRIVYSAMAVAVGFFACWWKREWIYDVMQRPIIDVLHKNHMPEKLVYLNPTGPFNLYMKISALAGFVDFLFGAPLRILLILLVAKPLGPEQLLTIVKNTADEQSGHAS